MQGIAASSPRNGADAPMRAPRPAAVIFQDEYVLLHQVESDDFWCLPGGWVEPGEHAAQTASVRCRRRLRLRPHRESFLYPSSDGRNVRPTSPLQSNGSGYGRTTARRSGSLQLPTAQCLYEAMPSLTTGLPLVSTSVNSVSLVLPRAECYLTLSI